jgi:hypothetical protein
MNKKRLNIVLIPLVILLWAFIIYKIISYTRPTSSDSASSITLMKNDYASIKKDTVTLLVNYRDPFVPVSYQRKKLAKITNSQISPIKRPVVTKPNWPPLEYGGLIENPKSDTTFAIIKINNKSELMTYNEEVAGMKILNLYPDSIQIRLQNEIRIFRKAIK